MSPRIQASDTSLSRVLVVEDEAVIQELLAEFLPDQGYEVVVAGDGETAIEMFTPGRFAVALVDYGLPGIHGVDVCRKLASIDPGTVLLLMTGLGGEDLAAREPCIHAAIAKPFDLFQLLKCLAEVAQPAR